MMFFFSNSSISPIFFAMSATESLNVLTSSRARITLLIAGLIADSTLGTSEASNERDPSGPNAVPLVFSLLYSLLATLRISASEPLRVLVCCASLALSFLSLSTAFLSAFTLSEAATYAVLLFACSFAVMPRSDTALAALALLAPINPP